MCGIFGVFGAISDQTWMSYCASELRHRGPDNCETVFIKDEIHAGATRLAMVDAHPRSNQPMIETNTGNILCFNGEIYNYREIKAQLQLTSVEFKTESDTEVVLKLLSVKGVGAVSELKGMFAFAFYSKNNKTLYLGRDRLGKKPLYFCFNSSRLYWSSEVKTLKAIQNQNKININSVISILSLGYSIDPNTMSSSISSILPGECLAIKLHGALIPMLAERQIQKWYVPSTIKNLSSVIDAAILNRVNGHDNVALSLSGGFDSSIIAHRLKDLEIPFTAFSCFWSDADKDRYNKDAIAAEELCKQLKVPFVRVEMPRANEVPNYFTETQEICGEPISNPTCLSMVALYKEIASNGFRLALTGDGSDEFFGGYSRHLKVGKFKGFQWFNSKSADFLASIGDKGISRKLRFALAMQLTEPKISLDLYWHEIFSIRDIAKFLSTDQKTIYDSLWQTIIEANLNPAMKSDNVQSIMKFDQAVWLPMESNRRLDRISMHFSIEARSPFQDDDLINLSIALLERSDYKELNKVILRSEFNSLYGLDTKKEKLGFISPTGHWIRNNKSFFKNLVFQAERSLDIPKKFSMFEHFDEYVSRNDFKVNQKIWTLACLGHFLNDTHINGYYKGME